VSDLGFCLAGALLLFALNLTVRVLVARPLARRMLGPEARPGVILRAAQSLTEGTTHLAFSIAAWWLLAQQLDAEAAVRSVAPHAMMHHFYPYHHIGWIASQASIPRDLARFYLMYGARYLQAVVTVFMEPRRRDFWVMVVHHALAATAVLASYFGGWVRIGLVVMALLDPSDVPLHLAKVCKYVGDTRAAPNARRAADWLFGMFAVSFVVLRLGIYPQVCWDAQWTIPVGGETSWAVGVASLWGLLLLNVYWTWLILRAVRGMLAGRHVEDDRSDDD
jgi:hypothetical protein